MLLWTFMGRFKIISFLKDFLAYKNLHLPGEKNDLQVQLVSKSRGYNKISCLILTFHSVGH